MVEMECQRWASKGINITYQIRENRVGYKAGALKEGLKRSYVKHCEYVVIFDADFQPEPDFLRRSIPFLVHNPNIALVQARWRFVNSDECLLTRMQEMSLDYHFTVEQEVGSSTHAFFGFNGTAGIWRIAAINEAGGWKDRTTVEDMDLAVRASLRGWKFLYLGDLQVKSELPSTFRAFRFQQHRWSCGPANLFRKMVMEIIRNKKVRFWKKVYVIYSFFFVRKVIAHWVTFCFYCVVLPLTILVPEVKVPIWGSVYIPSIITVLNSVGTPRSIHLLFYWILFENVMSLHRTKATLIGLFEAKMRYGHHLLRLPLLVTPSLRCSLPPIGGSIIQTLYSSSASSRLIADMASEQELMNEAKRTVTPRLCRVSGSMTEVMEIQAETPKVHVLFIPGNPGVVSFYNDFLESLHQFLDGNASITAVGQISHTSKDWESGKLFSLQEQIDHKVEFIRQELESVKVPIILVGHSIGSYISLEILRKCPEKVLYCIGLYPFLTLNQQSTKQSLIRKLAASSLLSATASFLVASLGLLSMSAARRLVSYSLGASWSDTAVQAICTHLRQYHTMRNVLYMAMTEFRELAAEPDWEFMRENQSKLAFLFGIDDHWGPLHLFEEISKKAPGTSLSIESEGHTHGFCCTVAGSVWVAQHVATLIKTRLNQKRL